LRFVSKPEVIRSRHQEISSETALLNGVTATAVERSRDRRKTCFRISRELSVAHELHRLRMELALGVSTDELLHVGAV
jgi:hypothetical protein